MKHIEKVSLTILAMVLIFGFLEKYNRLDKINYNANSNTFFIQSVGGHSEKFYKISREIRELNSAIVITNYCLSACAEYLLIAGREVDFRKRPIIGMHGNPFLLDIVKTAHFPDARNNCLNTSSENMMNLQFEKGIPVSYNLYQIKMLKIESVITSEIIHGCQTQKVRFKNYMWLPTSNQLKKQMGLQFNGSTCADYITECKKRASRRWKYGTKLVIGEEQFTSVGYVRSWFL